MGALVNRPAMNWRPLYAVAELAGGDWPERARKAAEAAAQARSDHDIKAELIIDIQTVMDADPPAADWPSELVADQLAKMQGRPWAEFGKSQKPITQNAVARLLKPFGIAPDYIGAEKSRCRGYRRSQFEEVFAAYAPSPPSRNRASVQNAMDIEQVSDQQLCSQTDSCTDGKTQKPASLLGPAQLHGCEEGGADVGGGDCDLEKEEPGHWGANGDPVVCALCDDPSEPLWLCETAEGVVPLHKECCRFWFKRHPQPRGKAITAVAIAEIPAPAISCGSGDLLEDIEPRWRP
jgi:Protein of unknown function (DUF3631)